MEKICDALRHELGAVGVIRGDRKEARREIVRLLARARLA
jgi:hypothetical protein